MAIAWQLNSRIGLRDNLQEHTHIYHISFEQAWFPGFRVSGFNFFEKRIKDVHRPIPNILPI
jgi:hypothetical protein